MRKITFLLIAVLTCVLAQAQEEAYLPEQICFSVTYEPVAAAPGIDERASDMDAPRAPMAPPKVYQEGYSLLFSLGHRDYMLYIKGDDDSIIYSTMVTTTETQVLLPSSLSGSYTIELTCGNWKFTGYITL